MNMQASGSARLFAQAGSSNYSAAQTATKRPTRRRNLAPSGPRMVVMQHQIPAPMGAPVSHYVDGFGNLTRAAPGTFNNQPAFRPGYQYTPAPVPFSMSWSSPAPAMASHMGYQMPVQQSMYQRYPVQQMQPQHQYMQYSAPASVVSQFGSVTSMHPSYQVQMPFLTAAAPMPLVAPSYMSSLQNLSTASSYTCPQCPQCPPAQQPLPQFNPQQLLAEPSSWPPTTPAQEPSPVLTTVGAVPSQAPLPAAQEAVMPAAQPQQESAVEPAPTPAAVEAPVEAPVSRRDLYLELFGEDLSEDKTICEYVPSEADLDDAAASATAAGGEQRSAEMNPEEPSVSEEEKEAANVVQEPQAEMEADWQNPVGWGGYTPPRVSPETQEEEGAAAAEQSTDGDEDPTFLALLYTSLKFFNEND